MEDVYQEVAELLVNQKQCVALTGAGISAESGIPTFRSKGGLWEKYDPMVYSSIEVFRKDPSKYWTIRGDFIRNYDNYEPNPAHYVLADLEKMGIVLESPSHPHINSRIIFINDSLIVNKLNNK